MYIHGVTRGYALSLGALSSRHGTSTSIHVHVHSDTNTSYYYVCSDAPRTKPKPNYPTYILINLNKTECQKILLSINTCQPVLQYGN